MHYNHITMLINNNKYINCTFFFGILEKKTFCIIFQSQHFLHRYIIRVKYIVALANSDTIATPYSDHVENGFRHSPRCRCT